MKREEARRVLHIAFSIQVVLLGNDVLVFFFVVCTSNRLESSHRCIGVSYMRHIRTNKAQVAIVSHLKEVARLSSRLICRLYATLLSPIQVNYSFFGSSYVFTVGISRKPPEWWSVQRIGNGAKLLMAYAEYIAGTQRTKNRYHRSMFQLNSVRQNERDQDRDWKYCR